MIWRDHSPLVVARWWRRNSVARRVAHRVAAPAAIVAALALVFTLLLRPSGSSRQSSPLPGLRLGQDAPLFVLKTMNGSSLNLRSFRGRMVLLNFWSTTCNPCREEMPDLQRAFESMGSGKATIIGIDAATDDIGIVRRFASRLHVRYPLVLDPLLSATIVAYHVAVLPTSVLVDPAGRLRMIHVGPMSYTQIARVLSVGS